MCRNWMELVLRMFSRMESGRRRSVRSTRRLAIWKKLKPRAWSLFWLIIRMIRNCSRLCMKMWRRTAWMFWLQTAGWPSLEVSFLQNEKASNQDSWIINGINIKLSRSFDVVDFFPLIIENEIIAWASPIYQREVIAWQRGNRRSRHMPAGECSDNGLFSLIVWYIQPVFFLGIGKFFGI